MPGESLGAGNMRPTQRPEPLNRFGPGMELSIAGRAGQILYVTYLLLLYPLYLHSFRIYSWDRETYPLSRRQQPACPGVHL